MRRWRISLLLAICTSTLIGLLAWVWLCDAYVNIPLGFDVSLKLDGANIWLHNTEWIAGRGTVSVQGAPWPKATGFHWIVYHMRIEAQNGDVMWSYRVPVYLAELVLGGTLAALIWRDRHIYASWRKTRRLGFPVAAITSPADSKSVTSHEGL